MKQLFLIRGVPGSGKSEFVKALRIDVNYNADMFHTNGIGEYLWKPQNVKRSHEWCREMVEGAMKKSLDVAVDNTFTTEWEMESYFKLAEQYGYRVTTVIIENRHGHQSIHNVPQETIDKMTDRFEIKLK